MAEVTPTRGSRRVGGRRSWGKAGASPLLFCAPDAASGMIGLNTTTSFNKVRDAGCCEVHYPYLFDTQYSRPRCLKFVHLRKAGIKVRCQLGTKSVVLGTVDDLPPHDPGILQMFWQINIGACTSLLGNPHQARD